MEGFWLNEHFHSTLPETRVTIPAPDTSLSCRFVDSIADIDAAQWNRLADQRSPFLRHEFLLALESSGCTTGRSGWQPCHALLSTPSGTLDAVMPLYVKDNSFGEYVFDWSWADAYRKHGIPYYPKLVTAVPFTPSAGPRVLAGGSALSERRREVLVTAVQALARDIQASSWHVLFPDQEQSDSLTAAGLLQRLGCQFHWRNRGYGDFDGFLDSLNSRKRKAIRKERAAVSAQGIGFQVVEGTDITQEQWRQFFRFYQNTYRVRGQQGYLNLEFFLTLGRTMPANLMLILALHDQQAIAGALFFKGENSLYGRYWGSLDDVPFLHFETCFYQGIDYAIRHGLTVFDAGAQGEHKIQRGFEPIMTWSNHWIAHPAFERAIAEFLQQEAHHTRHYIEDASGYLPFRSHTSS
ncbi:MAG: hypothetical protein RLZZ385_1855 [Pseudomonadota bacterium]|jgi:predicted N-acyltransferase